MGGRSRSAPWAMGEVKEDFLEESYLSSGDLAEGQRSRVSQAEGRA